MSIWVDKRGRRHIGLMVGGKRVHRILPTGTTARDAKQLEAEIRSALDKQGQQLAVLPGDPPMTAALALFVQHANSSLRSAESSVFHAQRIGLWAEKYTVSKSREFAAHVVRDLQEHYAPATINRSLATAKKGLAMLWEQGLTPENYGLRIKPLPVNNKREVFLSVEEVQEIASHCSEQMQAVIWAALLTGARRGELLKIGREHISRSAITFPAGNTKTNRTRVVPIIPALRPWLKFFPVEITAEGVKTAWQRARVAAGMPHVNFHDLRHSCASILLSLGVDLYTIGKILGHTNTQTTQRYAHLQIEHQRAALAKLGRMVERKRA